MNRRTIWLILAVLLLFASASAESELISQIENAAGQLPGTEIPEPLGSLLANDRINVHLKLDTDEELIFGLELSGRNIKSFEPKELSKPSLRVYASEETILQILKATNPLRELKEALDQKKISYKAYGLANKLKYYFLFKFTKVVSFIEKSTATQAISQETAAGTTTMKTPETVKETEETEETKEEPPEITLPSATEEETASGTAPISTGAVVEPGVYKVELVSGGFAIDVLKIEVGEKVIWKNVRTGPVKKAMILGSQKCARIKSPFFQPGESFSWTFKEAGECVIVDGIFTTDTMKVIVK